ncbi:MAG: response regulator [Firmicutes bacterium]|nr:response regulator [Bacillota bacterium]
MRELLLVDHHDLGRDVLARLLGRRGYELRTAKDGREALDMALERVPDLILLGLSLPEIDGLEVTRHLKRQPSTAGVPVIALTANATTVDRDRALAAGCEDFETKPVDLTRLLGKIERYLHLGGAPS